MDYEVECNGINFIIEQHYDFIDIGKITLIEYHDSVEYEISWSRLPISKENSLNNVLIALSGPIIMEFQNYNIVLFGNVNVEDGYDIVSVIEKQGNDMGNLVAKFRSYQVFSDNYISETYGFICEKLDEFLALSNPTLRSKQPHKRV